jgi:pimeloyl-ACP methyl ester carboxylesterase
MDSNSPVTNSLSPTPATEERFAIVDGARMRYLQAGSGRPLILLHGLMGYSFSWRFNIPVFAEHATVYAIDQLGTGFSERPPQLDCRWRSAAQRLLKFARAVGVSDFDLVGTSHGGAVAMMAAAMCAEAPDLNLGKLILVAPVNPWSAHGNWLAPFLGSAFGSALFLPTIKRLRWIHPRLLTRLYGDPARISPGTLEGYEAPVLAMPGGWEYGVSVARHWTADQKELEHAIRQLRHIPTLLLWGSDDVAVYAHSAEELRKHFDHCEVEIFPGVGHLPYEETPERFNAAVLNFLGK